MSRMWFDPLTGVKKIQDDSPGPGWLTIVTIEMPDGRTIESTLGSLHDWLSTSGTYPSTFDGSEIEIMGDADAVGRDLIPTIDNCRYFTTERVEDDDYQAWFIGIDPDAQPYDGDEFQQIDDESDDDTADIAGGGGGGGRPVPVGPPKPPWKDSVPFPEPGPNPGPPVQIPGPEEPQPDDQDQKPIGELAQEQADADIGMVPDPDGDIEHPDGAPSDKPGDMPGGKGPCSDCNGTGQKPDDGDGQDGGEEESDDGGDGGDDGDEEGSGDGDGEDGDGGSSPGGECDTCGGSGEMPDDEGEAGDGDDDVEEEDQPQPDDPYDPAPVVEAANRAIEAANRAISSDDPGTVSESVRECFDALAECRDAVDKRSATQRQVLQRAVDAAQRAMEVMNS